MALFYEPRKLEDRQKTYIINALKPLLKKDKLPEVRKILLTHKTVGSSIDNCAIQEFLLRNLGEKLFFQKDNAIFSYEFADTSNIKTLELPDNIQQIQTHAFANSDISNIKLNSGLKTIGNYAFEDAVQLHSFKIPNSIKQIGSFAFKGLNIDITVERGCSGLQLGPYALSEFSGHFYLPEGCLDTAVPFADEEDEKHCQDVLWFY